MKLTIIRGGEPVDVEVDTEYIWPHTHNGLPVTQGRWLVGDFGMTPKVHYALLEKEKDQVLQAIDDQAKDQQ